MKTTGLTPGEALDAMIAGSRVRDKDDDEWILVDGVACMTGNDQVVDLRNYAPYYIDEEIEPEFVEAEQIPGVDIICCNDSTYKAVLSVYNALRREIWKMEKRLKQERK